MSLWTVELREGTDARGYRWGFYWLWTWYWSLDRDGRRVASGFAVSREHALRVASRKRRRAEKRMNANHHYVQETHTL